MVKRAKKTAKVKADPFFRPFAKLDSGLEAGKKKAAKSTEKAPPPLKKQRAEPSAPLDELPPRQVDPDTFAVYMGGVEALPKRGADRIPATATRVERAAEIAAPRVDLDADARARLRSLVTDGLRFETADDGDRLEGRRLDVDPRELRRLRRGVYAIDGKVDLHGLNAEEARAAVDAFVKKRAKEGDKTILIIHGRGAHSPRGHAVLRGEISAWLSQGRASRHVQAFASAPDDLGGAGAVLVLLAR